MKSWYQSKTLWANALGGLATLFSGPLFGHVFAPEEVGAAFGIGNALLRFTTSTGLTK